MHDLIPPAPGAASPLRPRLSLTLPTFGTLYKPDELHRCLDVARAAEAAGLDAVKLPEHVVLGRDLSRYKWGTFPYELDAPWLEPMVTLGALAAVTERLLLETGVLIAPLRPAVLLAKQAATVDVLSGGRLVLGLGSGWQPAELEAGGVPYVERGERLLETISACRMLWKESPASFAGQFIRFHEVWCEPKPGRPEGIPIWLAGPPTERTFERVAALADGWLAPPGSLPDDVIADVPRFRAAVAARGRDPSTLAIATAVPAARDDDGRADLLRTLDDVWRLASSGVTAVSLHLATFASSPGEVQPWIERLGRRWHAS